MGVVYELYWEKKSIGHRKRSSTMILERKSLLGLLEKDRKAPINSKRPNFR